MWWQETTVHFILWSKGKISLSSAHSVGSECFTWFVSKSSTFGINPRRHLCAAACRPGQTERTGDAAVSAAAAAAAVVAASLSILPAFDYGFRFPALCGWWRALSEKTHTRTGYPHGVCAVAFVSNETLICAERRGQDARQRRRLTETQRLHPGVHGHMPPGRLYIPLLRLYVSASLDMEMEKLVSCTAPSVHSSRHPSLSIHHAPGILPFKHVFACGTEICYKSSSLNCP